MVLKQPSKRTLLRAAAPPKQTPLIVVIHQNTHWSVTNPNGPCCVDGVVAVLMVVVRGWSHGGDGSEVVMWVAMVATGGGGGFGWRWRDDRGGVSWKEVVKAAGDGCGGFGEWQWLLEWGNGGGEPTVVERQPWRWWRRVIASGVKDRVDREVGNIFGFAGSARRKKFSGGDGWRLADGGLSMPTDPHHTSTILQPSSSQPQKTHKPRKPKRKDTQVPQPSDPTEYVADEAVHKELGDSLVRAATTASSLETEHDSGNINKTQSKATPNEPSSQETNLGGGLRCKEAMGDTTAQTRFESVSKHFNDSLLARGNTLQSDEDRLELNELMALCTNLQIRVLDLEKTKTTQSNEIASLKKRVKKLEKKIRSKTHKLKRLYKVGLTARVESSRDEANLDSTATTTITTGEITLAQALEALKTSKHKAKGIVIQEREELGKSTTTTTKIPKQQSQDKGKGIMIEEHVKPKKKDQIRLDEEVAKRAFKRVNTFEDFRTELVKGKEKRLGEEMIQESTKKQKVEDDKETAELKQLMEIIPDKEEVAIDAIPLAVKSPRIVD
nr:hypothetical protein [Tanacetum cinerariifolium]